MLSTNSKHVHDSPTGGSSVSSEELATLVFLMLIIIWFVFQRPLENRHQIEPRLLGFFSFTNLFIECLLTEIILKLIVAR